MDTNRLSRTEHAQHLATGCASTAEFRGTSFGCAPLAHHAQRWVPSNWSLLFLPYHYLRYNYSTTSEILRWSKTCIQDCLSNVPVPLANNPKLQVHSTLVESPEPREVPTIPSDYMAFQDVFSKQAVTKLPPHWPWDCAIDLLPGAILPKGRVYPRPSRSARWWRITSRRLSNNS